MTQARVLLVSPSFHGYWRAIGLALQARGHSVACVRYDGGSGLLAAVRRRMVMRAADRGFQKALQFGEAQSRAIAALRSWRPDVVIVIKGDELGDAWREELDASRARRVTWFYDEIARMRYDDEAIASLGPIASYSPLDAAELIRRGLPARHLPIAYDRRTSPVSVPERNEVSFIGARYERREQLLHELDGKLAATPGMPRVRAYGRDWSPELIDRIRSKPLRPRPVQGAPGVDRAHGYGVMAASLATINMHERQDGFTVRTFESCGSGAVQLIDRRDVEELYEPGRELICFDDADHAAQEIQRLHSDPQRAQRIREAARKRTLAEHTFDHRVAVLEEMWA